MCATPGVANTTPKNELATAIKSPRGHNSNSTLQSYFIAVNLCPSSCTRDPTAHPIMTIGRIEMKA